MVYSDEAVSLKMPPYRTLTRWVGEVFVKASVMQMMTVVLGTGTEGVS